MISVIIYELGAIELQRTLVHIWFSLFFQRKYLDGWVGQNRVSEIIQIRFEMYDCLLDNERFEGWVGLVQKIILKLYDP